MADEKRYYAIVTDIGAAELANAALIGEKVTISELIVGDGGGAYYRPTADMTRLKGEKWRGKITSCEADSLAPNIVVIKAIVPYNVGGFTIREMGVCDDKGNLITIENLPEMEKVKSESGAAFDFEVTTRVIVSNSEVLDYKFDPTTVIATKRNIEEHNRSMNAHKELLESMLNEIDCGTF